MEQLEPYIQQNYSFSKLPQHVRQSLGNARGEWDRVVLEYSLSHQLRWRRGIGKWGSGGLGRAGLVLMWRIGWLSFTLRLVVDGLAGSAQGSALLNLSAQVFSF